MRSPLRAAVFALTGVLVLAGCGDDEAASDPTDDGAPAETQMTEDDADVEPGGEAASGTFTVNGDVYRIGQLLSCDTEGLQLDILAFDDSDDLNITFLVEINEAGEWNARIHGSTVEERYGDTSDFNADTISEEVGGDYELTEDTFTGEFQLRQEVVDAEVEPVTVTFNIPLPAELDPNCPRH